MPQAALGSDAGSSELALCDPFCTRGSREAEADVPEGRAQAPAGTATAETRAVHVVRVRGFGGRSPRTWALTRRAGPPGMGWRPCPWAFSSHERLHLQFQDALASSSGDTGAGYSRALVTHEDNGDRFTWHFEAFHGVTLPFGGAKAPDPFM